MSRFLTFCYGVICYLVFFLTFLYAIGFVGDLGLPTSVDRGQIAPLPAAIVVDLVLLGLFAVQHSGMARRGFKRWLTGWLPEPLERSTYVLLSSLMLILLFWQWRSVPGVLWNVQAPWAYWLLYGVFAFGWFLVLSSTFVIDHFDLFGLRQVWMRACGRDYAPPEFKNHFYYRIVRHPLYLGFIIAFWATPRMGYGHLLFAAAGTGYILIAAKFFEERDLRAMHGQDYRDYQRRVPMICPWPRPHSTQATAQAQRTAQ